MKHDIDDKELIKREKANLKFKALSVDKIFTDIVTNLREFLEIADALNTFQRKEIKQIRSVIKLIKRYHIAQLSEINHTSIQLEEYFEIKKKLKA